MSYGGSSGGSGSIYASSDVALSNPADGQVLTYNSSLSKWVNGVPAGAGEVPLDSFSGANDDAKLAAAMSYASAQTHPPVIRLSNRTHNFTQAVTMYNGFRLVGQLGPQNPEKGDAYETCRADISLSGVWLNMPNASTLWDTYIAGISFTGHSQTTFMGVGSGSASCVMWCNLIRDVGFSGFLTLFGTQAQRLSMNACWWMGWWQIINSYNGAVHIAGSDCRLWTDGGLVDSGASFATSGNAVGQYHIWLDYLSNSLIGPLYITCEAGWGGIKFSGAAYNSGSSTNLRTLFTGLNIEGRNLTQPCYGACMRVEGGLAVIRDCRIGPGMSNPSAMGHSPADAGTVHVTGGAGVIIDGCSYTKPSSISEAVPFVYADSGMTRVLNTLIAQGGNNNDGYVWTGLPRVQSTGSNAMVHDDTATQI